MSENPITMCCEDVLMKLNCTLCRDVQMLRSSKSLRRCQLEEYQEDVSSKNVIIAFIMKSKSFPFCFRNVDDYFIQQL